MMRDGDRVIKIDRTIPLWGILGVLTFIAGSAITTYLGFEKYASATLENTAEVKRLSGVISAMDVRYAEMNAHIQEHERRLNEFGARVMIIEQSRK